MFDDVFDKKGQLLLSRNTPKISSPLNTLGYSRYDVIQVVTLAVIQAIATYLYLSCSLHDPHCRKLFLKNKQLRSHLMHLGLVSQTMSH